MKAVILVGGEGTRLRPITLMMPKPVTPVANVPMMFYMLEWLKKYGIDEVIFVACYLPEKLRRVLGRTYKGIKLTYIYEDVPLGTGGAIKRAQKYMKGTTAVLNGDVITDFNIAKMLKFHKRSCSKATIGLYPVEDYSSFGVVELAADGSIKRFLEKPSREELDVDKANINAGVYLLEPEVLDSMSAGKKYSIERDVFPGFVGHDFYGFAEENIYWLDMGTPERLRKFTTDLLERNFPVYLSKDGKYTREKGARVLKPSLIGEGTRIGRNAVIGALNVIGRKCRIGEASVLENCILFDNVKVGSYCTIKNAIICSKTEVMDHVQLLETSVIGPGSRITRYFKAGGKDQG